LDNIGKLTTTFNYTPHRDANAFLDDDDVFLIPAGDLTKGRFFYRVEKP